MYGLFVFVLAVFVLVFWAGWLSAMAYLLAVGRYTQRRVTPRTFAESKDFIYKKGDRDV